MRQVTSYPLWNNITPIAITSSTDATPAVVTATAHGYQTDDVVMIYGHTTNVSINGTYKVVQLSANTFSLKNINSGVAINGSGAGAGSGGVVINAPKMPTIGDFRNAILQVGTSGGFSGTIKLAGSLGMISTLSPANPNFGATVTPANQYNFLQSVNLDSGLTIDGSTGHVSAGTDLALLLEVNTNAILYFSPILTAWTAGAITAKLYLTDNK